MDDSGEKWGINMLMGEYHHNIDEKKRLIIPSKFRSELGERVVLTRGLDQCLFLYREEEFNKIVETLVEFDKQGRIIIAPHLGNYAMIKKECTVIGTGDRVEIWSDDNWNMFYNSTFDSMSDIADELFSDNFLN